MPRARPASASGPSRGQVSQGHGQARSRRPLTAFYASPPSTGATCARPTRSASSFATVKLRSQSAQGRRIKGRRARDAYKLLNTAETLAVLDGPGVSVVTACTFVATTCEIARVPSDPDALVGCLGRDQRVRLSGTAPARHGHISKQGSAIAAGPARMEHVHRRPFYSSVTRRRQHGICWRARAGCPNA